MKLRDFFRLHFDLNTIVVLLVVIFLIHRPATNWLLGLIGQVSSIEALPDWIRTFVFSVGANLVSAIVIALIVFGWVRTSRKTMAVGRFKAYDTSSGKKADWGEVRLSYNLFSTRIVGVLSNQDVSLRLEASFDRELYLRGHYAETGNIARRRLGAFLLCLDGEGNTYTGAFAFVDPAEPNSTPKTGTVRWERL